MARSVLLPRATTRPINPKSRPKVQVPGGRDSEGGPVRRCLPLLFWPPPNPSRRPVPRVRPTPFARLLSVKRILILGLAFTAACGDEERGVTAPRIDAPYFILGAGGGGRNLSIFDIQVIKASELPAELMIPGSGTVEVDMFVAGLREEDLPAGLRPEDLEFVTQFDDVPKRPFVPLYQPHILAYPSLPKDPNAFVPIFEDDGEPVDDGQRRDRLEKLLENLRLKDPCRSIPFRQTFRTERIPATQVLAALPLSNGDTVLGLASTGTAAVGILPARGGAVELFGFELTPDAPLERDERTEIYGLTREEVEGPEARRLPRGIALVRGAVLPHVALWSSSLRRYEDVTPRTFEPAIGRVRSVEMLSVEGRPEICVTGSVIDGSCGSFGISEVCAAGLWCMDVEARTWTMRARIPKGAMLTGTVSRPGLPLRAMGITGTVYRQLDSLAPESWGARYLPSSNVGCEPACIAYTRFVEASDPARGELGVAVGDEGSAILLTGSSLETLALEELSVAKTRLFGDERRRGGMILQAAAFSADGALWLGGDRSILLRVSPDRSSAERICLPDDIQDSKVSALSVSENGDLIVAASPPRVAIGSWKDL